MRAVGCVDPLAHGVVESGASVGGVAFQCSRGALGEVGAIDDMLHLIVKLPDVEDGLVLRAGEIGEKPLQRFDRGVSD